MGALGIGMIPRVRLDGGGAVAAAPVQASAKGTALNGGNEGGETSERLAAAEARRRYLLRVAGEHENIFEAIAAGDAEAARAGMRLHLVNGRERRRRQSTS